MMNDNTKLYNTVQVQKLEAEPQFISESLTHEPPAPPTPRWDGYVHPRLREVSFVHSYWILTIISDKDRQAKNPHW